MLQFQLRVLFARQIPETESQNDTVVTNADLNWRLLVAVMLKLRMMDGSHPCDLAHYHFAH